MCPNHPHQPALLTCARCGTFACEACRSPADASLCVSCGGRFAPAALDVGQILQGSFGVLARHPGAVAAFGAGQIVFGLATLPLSMAMSALQQPQPRGDPFAALSTALPALFGFMIASIIYSAVSHAIFIRFLGDTLEGRERTPGEIVREGLGRALPLLALNFILGIALGLGYMMCIVPGVFLSAALMLATPAVVLQPAGPIEALSVSWDRTDGHRWGILLVLVVGFAILMGVGMVSGLGTLVLQRMGTPGTVVGTIISQGLSSLGGALFQAILVLCYLRLSGKWLPENEAR